MKRRLAARAIVLNKGRLLAVKLKSYGDAIQGNYWCLPGGSIEIGEDLVAAVRREMIEETGIEPQIGNLLYIQQFILNEMEHVEFFFHVTNSEDYLNIDLSKASHAEEEVAEIDFIDPKENHILPAFLQTEDIKSQTTNNLPTRLFSLINEK